MHRVQKTMLIVKYDRRSWIPAGQNISQPDLHRYSLMSTMDILAHTELVQRYGYRKEIFVFDFAVTWELIYSQHINRLHQSNTTSCIEARDTFRKLLLITSFRP